jgi:hypothetical protein
MRRHVLEEHYGFVCNCELCALPDDLSNALDKKFKLAHDANVYMTRFWKREEHNAIRALQLFDIYMSIIIRERLFFEYEHLVNVRGVFQRLGNSTLLQETGKALLGLLERHLGTGVYRGAGVETFSLCLEQAARNIAESTEDVAIKRNRRLDAQLQKTASNVISYLQSLP